MALPTLWREPQEFAQGDTLSFSRKLCNFPATDGWSLTYELRGGSQPIEFTSTATNQDHTILVDAATTATWLPGDYTMAGYAIKATERHQFYLATIVITPNFPQVLGNAPEKTFAQKMIEQLEEAMLSKASGDLKSSAVGDTRFEFWTMEEMRSEHGYWSQVRKNEIAIQNAKMGRPTGNKIQARFNVTGWGGNLGRGVFPY